MAKNVQNFVFTHEKMFKISFKCSKFRVSLQKTENKHYFHMAKIYYYLGIYFVFHKNDHIPIHIPGERGEFESKAELLIEKGKVIGIKIKKVKGKKPLKDTDLKNFITFVENMAADIIEKWVLFYVHKITPKILRYERRIRRKDSKYSKG